MFHHIDNSIELFHHLIRQEEIYPPAAAGGYIEAKETDVQRNRCDILSDENLLVSIGHPFIDQIENIP